MAIFQHNSRQISYLFHPAPFHQDLILLQGSKFTMAYWRDVLESLAKLPPSNGRILTCEWFDSGLNDSELAEDLAQLLKTLGLNPGYAIACADAVDIAGEIERLYPGTFDKTFFFPQKVPPPDDLVRTIREFFQI